MTAVVRFSIVHGGKLRIWDFGIYIFQELLLSFQNMLHQIQYDEYLDHSSRAFE